MPLKIKNTIFYTTLFMFCCMNIFFTAREFTGKYYILGGTLVALIAMVMFFYNITWLKERVVNGVTTDETQPLRFYRNILVRCAGIIFMMTMILLNFHFIWPARIALAIFLLMVTCCGVLTYIELWHRADVAGRVLRFIFYTVIPIVYVISSSYLESYFLVSTGLKIEDSPLIKLWLGWAYFAVCVLLVIQFSLVVFYFFLIRKESVDNFLNITGIMIGATFWVGIATGWFNNIQVLILDYATNKEWVSEFNCGNVKSTNYKVRYFKKDDDKYVAYFSDRGGKWGFDEVRCVIDSNGIGIITPTSLSEINKRGWFQDKK